MWIFAVNCYSGLEGRAQWLAQVIESTSLSKGFLSWFCWLWFVSSILVLKSGHQSIEKLGTFDLFQTIRRWCFQLLEKVQRIQLLNPLKTHWCYLSVEFPHSSLHRFLKWHSGFISRKTLSPFAVLRTPSLHSHAKWSFHFTQYLLLACFRSSFLHLLNCLGNPPNPYFAGFRFPLEIRRSCWC